VKWVALVAATIKLIVLIVSIWWDRDVIRKEIKKGAAQLYKEAIKERDSAKMIAADARLKNL